MITAYNDNNTFFSFYSYDSSGRFLTSISIGSAALEYSYNQNGDLISYTVNQHGIKKNISYDENSWVKRIEAFDSLEPISCADYAPTWNGRLDIAISPVNTSMTLVHDTLGNVVSLTKNGGLPERYVKLAHGIQHLIGDEVSICILTKFAAKTL